MSLTGSFVGIGVSASVSSVVPITTGSIRLNFSSPMSASALFLASGSYEITASGGSIPLSVISASAETAAYPQYMDLYFSNEMTNGNSNYIVTIASGSVDQNNNGLSPLSYSFSGYGIGPYITNVSIPNSLEANPTANISFSIFDTGNGVSGSTIVVYVKEGAGSLQQALTSSSFIAPFDGPGSALTANGNGYNVVIDPSGSLSFEVTLYVEAYDNSLNFLSTSFGSCDDSILLPSQVIEVPEAETLLLHWTFDNVTSSGNSSDGLPTTSDAKYIVEDVSSGSLDLTGSYNWFGPLRYHQYPGQGDFYLPYDTGSINVEHISSAKQLPPETLNSADMVEIRSDDDTLFTKEARPIKHFYAVEKSPYGVINDEILKIFGTIKDFNNLIGEPVNRYRQTYKSLDKLRTLYFKRLKNSSIDFEKFVDYFKWFDNSVSFLLQQLMPASSNFSNNTRTIIESHILERNKYWNKFPTLEMKHDVPEGGLKGINELLYDWESGSAPVTGIQGAGSGAYWWKHRAERRGVISSGDANVDASRTGLLSASLSTLNRSFTTSYNLSANQTITGSSKTYVGRITNIKNDRSLRFISASITGNLPMGNYNKDYEIVQTCGAYQNNRFLIKTGATASLTLQTPLSGGAQFSLIDRSPYKNQHIFVNRFSSPGEQKTMSRGYLDREAEEFSVYNNINYRNRSVRETLNYNEATHSAQFGTHPTASSFPNWHKTNRNTAYKIKLNEGVYVTASKYDNAHVQHAIPQNELQYAWITASALAATSPKGYITNFYVPTGLSLSTTASQIDFVTASSVFQSGIPVDFVGLNTLIYDPLTASTNTLSSSTGVYINSSIGAIASIDVLNALLNHRNGPYQHPSWKQIRTGEHPIAREHRRNNILSVYDAPKERVTFTSSGQRLIYKDKRSDSFTNFTEPSITTRNRPMTHVLNVKGSNNPVYIKHSYSNNISLFTNPELNNRLGLKACEDQAYHRLKGLYIDADQNELENPVDGFISLIYPEVIYPKEINAGKLTTRHRINFAESAPVQYLIGEIPDTGEYKRFAVADYGINGIDRGSTQRRTFWKDSVKDRTRWLLRRSGSFAESGSYETTILNSQGFNDGLANSIWPFGIELYHTQSMGNGFQHRTYNFLNADFGELNQIHEGEYFSGIGAAQYSGFFGYIENPISTSAYVKHYYTYPTASISYYHMFYPYEYSIGEIGLRYRTSVLANKNPWFNSYEDYSNDIKRMCKEYSILPEFVISNHMDYYVNTKGGDFRSTNDKLFELYGANTTSSAKLDLYNGGFNENFFKEYSHTDFLKYFDVIINDHDNTEVGLSNITLKCSGIKKLLPYNGFYPSTRLVQIASIFSQSMGAYIGGLAWKDGKINPSVEHNTLNNPPSGALALQSLLQPFFAPGIMFNTIKSGIAVDWPLITGSAFENATDGTSFFSVLSSPANYRLPFECLVDIKSGGGYGGLPISSSNGNSYVSFLHPAASASLNEKSLQSADRLPYCDWNGTKSPLYELAMHNFLAEVPNFFLKNKTFKTFSSFPENKILGSFKSGSAYYMDVSLFKSKKFTMVGARYNEDNPIKIITSAAPTTSSLTASFDGKYFGPPFKMTDFGIPPGPLAGLVDAFYAYADPTRAPYTPPYFYGKSTARIKYVADGTENNVGSMAKIISRSKLATDYINNDLLTKMSRFNQPTASVTSRPAWVSRMNLSSSVNLFGLTRTKQVEFDAKSINKVNNNSFTPNRIIDPDNTSFDVWTISPKFECPILNFYNQTIDTYTKKPYNSEDITKTFDCGKGMWSGYGKIPTGSEGVFMSIEESFPNLTDTEKLTTGSLIQALGFKQEEQRIGELADTKEISEAIVAIPFVDNVVIDKNLAITTKIMGKNFFAIDREEFSKQQNRVYTGQSAIPIGTEPGFLNTEIKETSISKLIKQMDQYVVPPEFNFLKYDDITPFVMYVFEFKHVLDKQDLSDIWQGVMPKIAYTAEKDEVEVSHQIRKWEFFHGKKLPPKIRWLVFKIKKRAETNYFSKTADTRDDDRFKFDFKIGSKAPDYQFNFPYDFFSLVELAEIEAEMTIAKNPDNSPIKSDTRLIPTSTPSLAPTIVSTAPTTNEEPAKAEINSVTTKPFVETNAFGIKKGKL